MMELFTIWPCSSGQAKQKATQKSPLWIFWRWQEFRKKNISTEKKNPHTSADAYEPQQLFTFKCKE